jgi:hypothetical protein
MTKQFKIEEKDGKFIVMVMEPTNRPFWKFWAGKTITSIAKKKDGSECIYSKEHHAENAIKFMTKA